MKVFSFFVTICLAGLMACGPATDRTAEPVQIAGNAAYQQPVFSDTERVKKMAPAFPVADQLFKDYAEKNHFPSIVYGIIADGRLIHSGVAGLANRETNQPATTKTLYRIASMSKSFTAMAILKLRDEGKLSLQDPAHLYIPALGKLQYLTDDSPPITIQHLLTMSAGFPEDNPWGDRQLEDSDKELIELVSQGLSFSNSPGLLYEYSNLGFALLGNIITKVAGTSYQQYITENILKPLGMNDSKWEYTDIPTDRLALGYHWVNEEWVAEPILHDGSFGAMGGLFCTIEDFGKYVAFHLDAWPPRNGADDGPVKRSTVREMHQLWRINDNSPGKNKFGPFSYGYSYGLGWRKDARGIVRISHSGGLPGYGSEWRIFPDYGIGIVSFSNRRYGAPGLPNEQVMDTLISIANLRPRELPVSKILETRKNELMSLFPGWGDNKEIFAENFYMDKSLDLRGKEIRELFSAAGEVKRVGELVPENQLRGSFVIDCTKMKIKVFFTLTPENNPLIQELELSLIN